MDTKKIRPPEKLQEVQPQQGRVQASIIEARMRKSPRQPVTTDYRLILIELAMTASILPELPHAARLHHEQAEQVFPPTLLADHRAGPPDHAPMDTLVCWALSGRCGRGRRLADLHARPRAQRRVAGDARPAAGRTLELHPARRADAGLAESAAGLQRTAQARLR